jgi:hypothetical protein
MLDVDVAIFECFGICNKIKKYRYKVTAVLQNVTCGASTYHRSSIIRSPTLDQDII